MKMQVLRLGARFLTIGALLACSSAALAQDVVQPPTVTLSVATGKTTAVVSWTVLGDACGGASLAENDVRYSLSPINECNFTSATQLASIQDGCADTGGAGVLSCNTTYYFAWKGKDSAGNWSDIATASATTKSCSSSKEVLCP
jgi:hypothetical protein